MFLIKISAKLRKQTNKNLVFSSPVKKLPTQVFNYTTYGGQTKEVLGMKSDS